MIHDGHLGELLVVKNLENFPVDFMVVSKLPSSDTPVIPEFSAMPARCKRRRGLLVSTGLSLLGLTRAGGQGTADLSRDSKTSAEFVIHKMGDVTATIAAETALAIEVTCHERMIIIG